jgi:phage gpG-like protein
VPVTLRISTAGGDEIVAVLAEIREATEDLMKAWPAVVRKLRQQLRYHFSGEGSTGRAGKWAALSAPYAKWKAKHYPGKPILERTGRLRASLVDSGSHDSLEILSPRFVFVGSRVPYAGFHQEGTSRMPRRPPISPTDRDVAEWMTEIQRYFNLLIRRAQEQHRARVGFSPAASF